MAISTRKKNILIAEWKTGIYKTKTALAKAHKLDPKTVGKIIGEIQQDNAELVESAVIVENAKKSLKNPMEITAVEKAVKTLTENEALVLSLTNKTLKGIEGLLDKGKYSKPIKIKNGDFDVIEQCDHDLTSGDYRNCIEAIDKASITLNVNQRHANSQVVLNNQNNQVQHTEVNKKIVLDALEVFENEY